MKIAPTPLLEKKRAAAAEPPIPITRVKRDTKVAAGCRWPRQVWTQGSPQRQR